ncbi:zinc protease [Azospirillum fermentarium]|uniref:M16 family metallopeptidase n=1 Tax=Azospirillum fermentarium TaxID=1233114 RepID=UPI00222717DB|nr:pitrilysin family protein [Azospirillum fermentarium]MCW2246078.1 zinc protease [Azospirillum fermentarium]
MPALVRRSLLAAAAVLALSAAPASAQDSATAPPPAAAAAKTTVEKGVFFPESFTLPNGMQVVVITNTRVPVVTHMVWYRVGAADEPRGTSGIAHFLEHLMFKGTKDLAPGAFSRIVAKNGGQDNAFTSWDYTAFYQSVARDRLEMVMRMEAGRMTGLQLTDEVVYPERDVIIEERRQRVENDPADRMREQVDATFHVHHPYGTPVIGWPQEMAALTREDAEAFYRTWYAPNNAILVVSGDVTAADLKPLAEKYYGAIPARPLPARSRVSDPPLTAARRVVLQDEEVRQPSVYRMWHAPSYRTDADKQAYALQVLTEVMSGGATGRLYRALVVDQKIATSAWMGYSPVSWDGTSFIAGISPAPGVAPDTAEAALLEQVRILLDQGVTEEEVETAKRRMLAEAAYARDSLSGPAQTLGASLATGQSIDDVESWPVRIDAVTAGQVTAAARAVLGRRDHVTGVLLPAPAPDSAAPAAAPASVPGKES